MLKTIFNLYKSYYILLVCNSIQLVWHHIWELKYGRGLYYLEVLLFCRLFLLMILLFRCIESIRQVMKIIDAAPSVVKEKNSVDSQTPTIDVQNSIFHFVERLEQEYFKSLQDNDFQKVAVSFIKIL